MSDELDIEAMKDEIYDRFNNYTSVENLSVK